MSRRYGPIKVGATKTLRFRFVDDDGVVVPIASGSIAIWDAKTRERLVDDVVVVTDNVMEYGWTAPAISGPVRHCKVEFRGVESIGSEVRKSGADGKGDLEIDIVESYTAQGELVPPSPNYGVRQYAYAPSVDIAVAFSSAHTITDALSGDIALDLDGGVDGHTGLIAMRQDGLGGRSIVAITAAGRTVLMTANLSVLNTPEFLTPDAATLLTYDFQTIAGVAFVIIGIAPTKAIAF